MRVSAKVDHVLRATIELAAARHGADDSRPVKVEALDGPLAGEAAGNVREHITALTIAPGALGKR